MEATMDSVYRYLGHEILIENVERAEGVYIYDADGHRFMDMESGVWCLALGHGCPAVNEALVSQANKLMHAGYVYTASIVTEAADKILHTTEMKGGKCMFLSSGSEAVESGAQIMKRITGKKLLMTFSDSFLGSHGTVAHKKQDEWFLFDWGKCAECRADTCDGCQHLEDVPFGSIAGFIFEPGSSGGMVRFAPEKVVSAIAERVKSTGGYCMVNEVTTGIGRTGRMFGFEHYSLKPDIIAVGKSIGNGYPVSCVVMSKDVSDKAFEAGVNISQSHQNDPLGAAVALAVLKEIEDQNLIGNSADMGKYLYDSLCGLKEKFKCISDVRGRGLMLSITFDLSDEEVKKIFKGLFDKGFILAKRPNKPVLRLDPPLIISKSEIDAFTDVLKDLLTE
jgi:acetylornithine aminotransferase